MHRCHIMFICICFCSYCKHFVTEKEVALVVYRFFLHNCTYLTFDLIVTLNRKITLGIHHILYEIVQGIILAWMQSINKKCHQESL